MANIHAIVMKAIDNVCTVVEMVEPGATISTCVNGRELPLEAKERIPFGHKVAIRQIKKGAPIIKYGETIGLATKDIEPGQHVHVHNLESCRGRGDK